ncbi:peptidoglycan DD-metalloendopeptidase family protein [Candidatus Bathyarchaeota archaeon]|nr:peptidoglycan DD-metalloendopeptidase family protein [Candidatus Bathyarchaeota archaeon]
MPSKSRLSLLAIVIVGIVIVGSIGSYLLTSQTPQTAQMTTTQSVTSKPVVFFKLFGKIFFDYDGNGIQGKNEPPVPNVTIALDNTNLTVTNSTGGYVIDSVPKGYYQIRVFAPKNFRYMCESASEFRTVKETYTVSVRNDTRKDIGLMEGILTLPFPSTVKYPIDRYYDWNTDPKNSLWWNGEKGNDPYDHGAIDYAMMEGTLVHAAAPGIVSEVRTTDGVNFVRIKHSDGFYTSYEHISKSLVTVGQHVSRGEKIAESGKSGTFYPHLDFNIRLQDGRLLDPYSPTFNITPEMSGYWFVEKTGQNRWISVPIERNPNGLGYWTKYNDPQYFE